MPPPWHDADIGVPPPIRNPETLMKANPLSILALLLAAAVLSLGSVSAEAKTAAKAHAKTKLTKPAKRPAHKAAPVKPAAPLKSRDGANIPRVSE